jgi:hypothetical protein
MGGLSRRAFQITTLTGKDQPPVLLLDAGNLLFKRPTVAHSQELLTAGGLMAIHQRLGYDAVAVGPTDLAAGVEFLKRSGPRDFPWLSANLRDKKGIPIFPATRIIKRGAIDIGILGLTGPQATALGTQVVDWRAVLPEQLDRLGKECQLVIVLSSLPAGDNIEIAKEYPQVQILIAAGQQQPDKALPRVENGTLVTQTLNQGKTLGVLDLDWAPGNGWDMGPAEPHYQPQQKSRFTSAVIQLTKNLPEDPQTAAQIQMIKEQQHTNSQAAAPDHRQNPPGSETEAGLAGFPRCLECHQVQAGYWRTTRHAESYSRLRQQQQNFNVDCLSCHTTQIPLAPGATKAPSFEMLLTVPPGLQAVGCEVCHGPGLAHAATPENVKSRRKVDEKICISCHTKERDPLFDYRQKLPRVSCPAE